MSSSKVRATLMDAALEALTERDYDSVIELVQTLQRLDGDLAIKVPQHVARARSTRARLEAKMPRKGSIRERVLIVLARKGPQRTKDLTQKLGVPQGSISSCVARFNIDGLITSAHRGAAWELTTKGRRIAAEVVRRKGGEA